MYTVAAAALRAVKAWSSSLDSVPPGALPQSSLCCHPRRGGAQGREGRWQDIVHVQGGILRHRRSPDVRRRGIEVPTCAPRPVRSRAPPHECAPPRTLLQRPPLLSVSAPAKAWMRRLCALPARTARRQAPCLAPSALPGAGAKVAAPLRSAQGPLKQGSTVPQAAPPPERLAAVVALRASAPLALHGRSKPPQATELLEKRKPSTARSRALSALSAFEVRVLHALLVDLAAPLAFLMLPAPALARRGTTARKAPRPLEGASAGVKASSAVRGPANLRLFQRDSTPSPSQGLPPRAPTLPSAPSGAPARAECDDPL